ncbi:hypothetical protein CC2G_009733 [Coprinopsis cinerea AmutBmut pab1-1]|nr:hypothetical protein CC2G_009733 [Coprinopsis cinerea AmutBmut pab1-1]
MAIDPVFAGFVFLHSFTVFVTLVRFGLRIKTKRTWWDDFWALMAVFGTILIICNYCILGTYDRSIFSASAQSYFTWSSYMLSPTTLWMARTSILMTIVYILPNGMNRLITQISAIVFLLFWVAHLLAITFMCGVPVPSNLVCEIPRKTTAISLTFELISTAWLMAWPGYLLYRLKPSVALRNFIITCVVTGAALTALDIGHAYNLTRAEKTGAIAHYKALNTTGNLHVRRLRGHLIG